MGLSQDGEALVTTRRDPDARQSKGILVYLFESSLFFVNTEYFADRVRVALENAPGTRYLVLNTSLMMYADSMAVAVLTELAEEMEEHGIVLLLGGGHGRFHQVLYSSGLADKIGRDHIFTTPEEAFDAAKKMRNASGDANVEQRGSALGEAPA